MCSLWWYIDRLCVTRNVISLTNKAYVFAVNMDYNVHSVIMFFNKVCFNASNLGSLWHYILNIVVFHCSNNIYTHVPHSDRRNSSNKIWQKKKQEYFTTSNDLAFFLCITNGLWKWNWGVHKLLRNSSH